MLTYAAPLLAGLTLLAMNALIGVLVPGLSSRRRFWATVGVYLVAAVGLAATIGRRA